jgi:hypothetical protein
MMLDPQIARAGLRIGFLVLLLAAGMLPFLAPTSAEFVASLLAASTALLFILGVAVLLRRPTPGPTGPSSSGLTTQAPVFDQSNRRNLECGGGAAHSEQEMLRSAQHDAGDRSTVSRRGD